MTDTEQTGKDLLGAGSTASEKAFEFLVQDDSAKARHFVAYMQKTADEVREAGRATKDKGAGRVAANFARWASLGREYCKARGILIPEPPTPSEMLSAEIRAPLADPDYVTVSDQPTQVINLHQEVPTDVLVLPKDRDPGIQKMYEQEYGSHEDLLPEPVASVDMAHIFDDLDLDAFTNDWENALWREALEERGRELMIQLVNAKTMGELFLDPVIWKHPDSKFKTTVLFFPTVTNPTPAGRTVLRGVTVNGATLKAKHPDLVSFGRQGFIRSTCLVPGKSDRWVKAVIANEGMIWRWFVSVDGRNAEAHSKYGVFRNGQIENLTKEEYRKLEDDYECPPGGRVDSRKYGWIPKGVSGN